MCGIAVTWKGPDRCSQMLKKMEHRGLPEPGYRAQFGGYGCPNLGHVRLPIINPSIMQDQPMINDKIAMVFVGEIYNYLELDPGANSDTEVLFNMLGHDGPNALNDVDGMYAIVYYDFREHLLHVLTDHLSKKPLYMDIKTYEIASELKALDPGKYGVNKKYMANVARFGYNPNSETPFCNIIQIPPNTHLIITTDGELIWDYNFIDMSPYINRTEEHAIEIIGNAVKNRLVSDVPISFLLSGGLDSSIVCMVADEMSEQSLNTFYIENDEAVYSRMMSGYINSNHISLDINQTYDLREIMYFNESPVDLGSVVPQYLLCGAIKHEGYRVVITGDGADELFGGYTRMRKFVCAAADTQYHDIYNELPYYHCPRLDKMSMCHTVELRSPFLSRDVVRLATALSYEERINKKYLKNLFKDYLPDDIIKREKAPLRIDDMKVDREKFKYDRISLFMNIVKEGRYGIEH